MSRDYVLQPFRAPIELQIDYASELNEQQCAAVTSAPSPALVIAGAGSGKTRTLTYRVAYLLEQGIPPDRILLLTFTNKAAREMMRRVGDLIGGDLSSLWGGTFHSMQPYPRRHAGNSAFAGTYHLGSRDSKIALSVSRRREHRYQGHALSKAEVLSAIFSLRSTPRNLSPNSQERLRLFPAPQADRT